MIEGIYLNLGERPYSIYALIDPRDTTVRYVGVIVNLCTRYNQHLGGNSGGKEVKRWIAQLQQLDLAPKLQLLETIPYSPEAPALAGEREYFWIQEMLSLGYPLVNKAGVATGSSWMGPDYKLISAKITQKPIFTQNESVKSDTSKESREYEDSLAWNGELYFTTKEACSYLDVSEETLRKKAKNKGIKRYTKDITRTVYYRKSDLDKLNELRPLEDE